MPEYHQNPYLAPATNSSPSKRPLVGHYATLTRRGTRGIGGGGGGVSILSQPEPSFTYGEDMAYVQGNNISGLSELGGGGGGGGGGSGLESELYPGALSQLSYGSAVVQNSASRRRVHHRVSPSPEEGGVGGPNLGGGALSQPADLPTNFYTLGGAGGGSMRNPAPSRPPGGRVRASELGRMTALTQHNEEEQRVSLARTSSVNPRRPGAGGGQGATPHHLAETTPTITVQVSATSDEPVDWKVRGKTSHHGDAFIYGFFRFTYRV